MTNLIQPPVKVKVSDIQVSQTRLQSNGANLLNNKYIGPFMRSK